MHVFILEQAEASDAQPTGVEELLVAERKAHEVDKGNVSNSCREVMSSQNMSSFIIELGLVGLNHIIIVSI